ncbi:hypothetical protein O181_008760 [Austropuccinia psidii MF-1]|uniref:Integrase catalytic domain-containing protein n=1 Tax=Austropuccinia psidii MF-1 TaxID=1389203 RepID=A0A9Q3GJ75_9BASI|nr:hypothetical protein [Austropuccinia psidii MF-1]
MDKFTKRLGKSLSLSTSYHPQTDSLAERMIEDLEDIISRFCAFGLDFKDSNGFNHDWCTLIPDLDLAYKTTIHASTRKTSGMLEKGWNPRLPVDTLKKDLAHIHPGASIFKLFLDKVRHHAKQSMTDALEYPKKKWDKSHKAPEFKVGALVKFVYESLVNSNNIKSTITVLSRKI